MRQRCGLDGAAGFAAACRLGGFGRRGAAATGGLTTTAGGTTVTAGRGGGCACRRLGHNGADRRLRRNGARGGRSNNRRCLARLRHNLPRFRPCRVAAAGGAALTPREAPALLAPWRDTAAAVLGRQMAPARLGFFFLLLGQDGLHHVAGLGNMREIDFGCNRLGARDDPAPRGLRRASRAGIAREPFRPRVLRSNWSGSCPRPGRAPPSTSRICRLLTSISRARSLIRTLLIRLFSECATQSP